MSRGATAWFGSARLNQSALGLVASLTPRPMQHGQGAVRIGVHPDRDRHSMEPVRGVGNLQRRALSAHRVGLGHAPFFVHTQPVGEVRPDPRDAGGARFGRSTAGGRPRVETGWPPPSP